MGKRTSKRRQKLYKMKGCSKTKSKKARKYSRKYLGGSSAAYPNQGPEARSASNIPTNMGSGMRGGSCSSCGAPAGSLMTGGGMKGGSCGSCGATGSLMTGGGCGCGKLMTGGAHTLEPAGLVGDPWTPNPNGWPGVDGVDGNRNYLDYNAYREDPQTALINVGANRPFLFGGRKYNRSHKKLNKYKKMRHRGGSLSNLLSQDIINLGRQTQFGIGSAYNAMNGYDAPRNPLPWKGQLPNTPNLDSIKSMSL
jgi:hypothetical protein